MKKLLKFLKDEEGAAEIEYCMTAAFMTAFIAVVIIVAVAAIVAKITIVAKILGKSLGWSKIMKRLLGGIERLRGRETYKRKPI